jgi:hypothetical protein
LKLDIEFDDKQLSFGRVLLYRRNILTRFIRNRSPIEIFWQLDPNGSLDPQISITPTLGIVKAQSDQKIEFCYYANKVNGTQIKFALNILILSNNINT